MPSGTGMASRAAVSVGGTSYGPCASMLIANRNCGGPASLSWLMISSVIALSAMYLPSFGEVGGNDDCETKRSKPISLNALVRFQNAGSLPWIAVVV